MSWQKKFEEILSRYSAEDKDLVNKTISTLCDHGIGKGCYQDYGVLADIVTVLSIFANAVANKEENNVQNFS